MNMSFRSVARFMAIITLVLNTCCCQSIYNATDLINNLFTNYKTELRPTINQSEEVRVNFSMELMSVIDFDEVNGILYINCILVLSWIDERLTWDPTNYNGISEIFLKSDQVWTPMVVHINSVEKTEKIGSDDEWQLIRYLANGNAYYYPGGLFSSSCSADVSYYPLDTHTCTVEFVAWGFGSTEQQFNPVGKEVLKSYYSPNGVWRLKGSHIKTSYQNVQVNVELTLERKPRFVTVNVILPMVFMSLLNMIVFLIPMDGYSRVSYSVTMLLTVTVFLTLVSDNLPKSSSPMAIISYYLLLILTLSVMSIVINITSWRCYSSDAGNINKYWRFLIRISRLKIPKKCRRNAVKAENGQSNTGNINSKPDADKDIEQFNTHVSTDEENNLSMTEDPNQHEDTDVTWKDVSVAIDKVSFVVSLSVTIISSLIFFAVIFGGS